MRIQVITKDNGFGLSKDVQVVREAFPGHEVVFTPWDRPRSGVRFHWNIHLELLNPAQFRTGQINAFVPNPEWMMQDYPRYFQGIDVVLAKTRDCERIMQPIHRDVRYTGWTSPDTSERVDFGNPRMVHFGGNSISKGTEAVIEAADICGLQITVIWKKKVQRPVPSNVRLIHGRIEGVEYADLLRSPIHICPSSYEGFGHYINEARAMGAVVVSTNAAPMNELVDPSFGLLVPHCEEHPMRFAVEKRVCPDSLAECMGIAWANLKEHGPTWGERARAAYEQGRIDFIAAINEVVK